MNLDSSHDHAVFDRLDAAMKRLLAFLIPPLEKGEKTRDAACGEFIHLASQFVAALEEAPNGLEILESKVLEVLHSLDPDRPPQQVESMNVMLGKSTLLVGGNKLTVLATDSNADKQSLDKARRQQLDQARLLKKPRKIGPKKPTDPIANRLRLSKVYLLRAHELFIQKHFDRLPLDHNPAAVQVREYLKLKLPDLNPTSERVAAVEHSLDDPAPFPSSKQILELGRQMDAFLTARELTEIEGTLPALHWYFLQLAQKNCYLGSWFLWECRQTSGSLPWQQLTSYCRDMEIVVPAVKEAAEALCCSLKGSPDTQPLAQYVFRVDSNDDDRFHIRFENEEGHFDALEGLKIIHRLLHDPNPTNPQSAVQVSEGCGKSTAAEQSHWNEVICEEEELKELREKYLACKESLAQNAVEEGEDLEKHIRVLVKNPDDFLGKGAAPIPKRLGKTTEEKARDLIRKHFASACKHLEKKMPKLVQHLKCSMRPKPKEHWAYRPDSEIPWQLD